MSIHCRRATAADSPRIDALHKRVFGTTRDARYWKWAFSETPGGPGLAVLLEESGVLIAHAALIRRRFRVAGEHWTAGQSVDAMTHPDHRRRGLHRRAMEELFESACDEYGLIYGFTNEHSTPGALGFQRRSPIAPLPILVRPLLGSWKDRLRRRAWPDACTGGVVVPNDLDSLRAGSPAAGVMGEQSADAYRWRTQRPGGTYRTVENRSAGALEGWAILALRRQGPLRAGFVLDALTTGSWRASQRLVDAVFATARDCGCDVVSTLSGAGHPWRRAWLSRGALPVIEALSPETLVLSARKPSGAPLPSWMTRPDSWSIRWAEHDVV